MTYPHKTRQALLFSLVGILPMLVLCGISHADFVNPFDLILNRQAIKVVPGQVVTVERKLASLTYPVKFNLTGALPQGEVEYFAMVGYQAEKKMLAQRGADNPFADVIKASQMKKANATAKQILDETGLELKNGKWSRHHFSDKYWKPDFFPWHSVDRIVPYKSGTNNLTKVTFDGYQTLLKEHFTKNKIFTLLFAIAPKGKVQKLKLNKAVMVRVNLI